VKKFPISKYVGTFPKGEWVFVKDFSGSYKDALLEAIRLQNKDPKTGRKKNHYRIWNNV